MKRHHRNRKNNNNDQREAASDYSSNVANESTPIYLTSDSTLQTPEEDRRDKSKDPRNNDSLSVSNDDLHETKGDRLAGSDRAGTSERKDNMV
jgi:hypothetical protein